MKYFTTTLAIRAVVFGALALALSLTTPALADEPAAIVYHTRLPHAIDPASDPTLAEHYAWFNPDESNHQLLVYLPGSGGTPGAALLYQQRAAQLGYHVIGLSYETGYSLSKLCNTDPDPNSCFYDAHFEIVYGVDTGSQARVSEANSIVHLLTAWLRYLADTYPDEGWSRFLDDGSPRWSSIALSGLSQGAGNAAMIAKYAIVPRVVMFSGVTDAIPGGAQACQGSNDWLTEHITPTARYWGLAHDLDPNYPSICRNWDSIGISRLGPQVQFESATAPYSETHQLFTHLLPQGGYAFAHPSTIRDQYLHLEPDGSPSLAPAWSYLLTAKADDEPEQ